MVQERLIGFGTANIKVFGVGGCGGNAINRMYKDTISGIQFVAVNTDDLLKKDDRRSDFCHFS